MGSWLKPFSCSRRGRLVFGGLVVLPIVILVSWQWVYVTWQLRIARSALQQGDVDSALEVLQRAEQFQPERAELLYLLGRSYRRAGQIEQVLDYVDRAARRGWPEEELRHQRYLTLVQIGRFQEAESYLKEILRTGCSDELAEEVYEAQAKGYLKTFRLSDAVLCLNHWIEWRPNSVQPRVWLADVWERCDRWQAAREEYQAILQIHPEHHETRRRLAVNLLKLNKVRSALKEFETCLEENANDVEALIGVAGCQRRLANVNEADRRFHELLRYSLTADQRAQVLVELGQMAIDAKDLPGAIELLTRAREIDPEHALAHSSLATAYLRTGDVEQAVKHREQGEIIRKRFARLTEITHQLSSVPGDADLRWEAGMILMKQGLNEEGAAWMATALTFDPQHNKTHQSLADYYTEIGDHGSAEYHRSRVTAPLEKEVSGSDSDVKN